MSIWLFLSLNCWLVWEHVQILNNNLLWTVRLLNGKSTILRGNKVIIVLRMLMRCILQCWQLESCATIQITPTSFLSQNLSIILHHLLLIHPLFRNSTSIITLCLIFLWQIAYAIVLLGISDRSQLLAALFNVHLEWLQDRRQILIIILHLNQFGFSLLLLRCARQCSYRGRLDMMMVFRCIICV